MASSRVARLLLFVCSSAFASSAFAVVVLGPAPARAADAGAADGDRYAQKVASAVATHLGEVRACYSVALERNPQLAGRFDATWTIDTAGKPQAVPFEKPPEDANFAACMVRTITAWRFEKTKEPAEVTFPFVFNDVRKPAPPAPAPGTADATGTAPPAEARPQPPPAKTSPAKRKRAPSSAPAATDAPPSSKR